MWRERKRARARERERERAIESDRLIYCLYIYTDRQKESHKEMDGYLNKSTALQTDG